MKPVIELLFASKYYIIIASLYLYSNKIPIKNDLNKNVRLQMYLMCFLRQ